MQWWSDFKGFSREVVAETKKVTWPSQKEVVNTTGVVLVASLVFGLYLFVCDFFSAKLVEGVLNVFGVSQ